MLGWKTIRSENTKQLTYRVHNVFQTNSSPLYPPPLHTPALAVGEKTGGAWYSERISMNRGLLSVARMKGVCSVRSPPPTLLSTHNWALQTAESSVEYTPLQRIQAHGTRLGFKNEVWRSSAQISAYKSGIKNSVFRCNSGSVKRNFGSKILRILIF